ncbi:hypothetical protein O181_008139 [Austropuccinia psidii MF-1]|uniref:Uncharacterized protein n=1 Tax=Austropuccinia psidii MF-1 TaxID=1389203 RepID=A0A9Q3BNB2_9BASI|nr:hypothetical protein [Austropuccinia psidii MF-1]
MSPTYRPAHTQATSQAPAHAHTTLQAPANVHNTSKAPAHAHTTSHAPAASSSTYVTRKWLIPLDIRPSHALPLCACVTPMHLLHCGVGSNHFTHSC